MSKKDSDPNAANTSTIRSQLLWAALFPLVYFGLLSTLVTSSALNRLTLDLVIQRNTAQVQAISDLISMDTDAHEMPTSKALTTTLQLFKSVKGSHLYLADNTGRLVASSEAEQNEIPFDHPRLLLLIQSQKPASQLMESSVSEDEAIVSYAPSMDGKLAVILEEPWAAIMSQAFNYQLILVGLLTLGAILSLTMLSIIIGRLIRPIVDLADNAARAIPGSIFHPVPEQGPLEVRTLIKAYNQMVIRLAEQQNSLRQYAHKALLSQEKERQRLSHELHDGTVQDLVALAQRVELCRNELERDPIQARRRLDELQGLVGQTLSDVRRISNALRPPVLEDLGLPVALQTLCNDLETERPSAKCSYNVHGSPQRLQGDLELAVYRVAQETLSNIRKHAPDVTRVQVNLFFEEGEIRLSVRNNGGHFPDPDVRSLVRAGHLGLAGMYERARLFGGKLEIKSEPDDNTVVILQLPSVPEE